VTYRIIAVGYVVFCNVHSSSEVFICPIIEFNGDMFHNEFIVDTMRGGKHV